MAIPTDITCRARYHQAYSIDARVEVRRCSCAALSVRNPKGWPSKSTSGALQDVEYVAPRS